MGVEHVAAYDVVDSALPAVQGEDGALDPLVEQAYRARPESAAYESELAAQDFSLRSLRGAYLPSLGAQVGATLSGPDLGSLEPNASGQLTLNWNLFNGGQTHAEVIEAESQRVALEAQRDAFKLQVRLDVEQAQLAVQAAKETLAAAQEAYEAAQAQLTLAEGRYQAGVGNIIELSDAQAGLTTAAAQKVSAVYSVATARANLMAALGVP
jgi:outer membrane protein